MAIRNDAGNVAGLSYATSMPTIQNMSACALFQLRQAHTSGEVVAMVARVGTSNWISISTDVTSSQGELRIYTASEWAQLSGTSYALNSWVAIGFACGGVGTDLLRIMLSTSSGATPVSFTRTLGGSTGTTTLFEAIHTTLFSSRGSHLDIQNLKVGAGYLTAAQLHDEAWATATIHSGSWTPVKAPMTDGDLTAQASPFTVVNASELSVVEGPLAGLGGGSLPALLRRRMAMSR